MSDKARNTIAARMAAVFFHFSSQQRVCFSAVPAACRRRRERLSRDGDVRHDMGCALAAFGGGGGIVGAHRQGYAVPTAEGKRGIRHRMVSYPPLNSPSSSFGRDSLRSRV